MNHQSPNLQVEWETEIVSDVVTRLDAAFDMLLDDVQSNVGPEREPLDSISPAIKDQSD